MRSFNRLRVLARLILCAAVVGPVGRSMADIGPPVAIRMPADTAQAVSGQEYDGTFEIHVYQSGDLTDFRIEGEGWSVASSSLPTASVRAAVGTTNVTFRANPADADKPVGLSLRYNGRLVRTLFEVGPAHAARKAQPYLLNRIPNTSGLRPTIHGESQASVPATPSATAGGAGSIRVVGRIVYDRPGIDRSDPADGDFDDPEDTPPATVGADSVRVYLFDEDTSDYETIWLGITDEQGYFDSGVVTWDDTDAIPIPPFIVGDTPDLFLKAYTTSPNTAGVWGTDLVIYDFRTPTIDNFEGDFFDYGSLKPDAAIMPAFHLLNNVVRATRFVLVEGAGQSDGVGVVWPDDSRGDTAWYTPGEDAIHISTDRQWRTDTIIHEFGHHHMNLFYNPIPALDYCDADSDCDPNPPADCGHCMWCGENAAVAWFEGWPNWLADVVTRDFPNRYTFDDGTPFTALYTRSQESLDTCDGFYNNPETTEGFVGALLRDIEDETQDDHDDDPDPAVVSRDGVFDLMCLGVDEIFQVMEASKPQTVIEFIEAFRAAYPQHTDDLWATAFNVGGSAYIASFPADAHTPGAVTNVDSKTHPLGVGGSLPCINFDFDPAPDDVTGANVYSYTISTDAAGWEPDTEPEPVVGTDECQVRGSMVASDLGEFYISIKAQDNDGNWSNDWQKAGPFEVTDCNNNGIMDVCDITCDGGELNVSGICLTALPSLLCNREGCGQSQDCNGNIIPDSCDIGYGTSEDCDLNGVPDECQAMKHWASKVDPPEGYDWGLGGNWKEGERPVLNDVACIPADSYGATVVFTEADAPLTSLACALNFIIDGPATPWPEHLELDENSFVLGDLELSGNSTITVNTRLYVDGRFYWKDGGIDGYGVTEVNGGLSLTQNSVNLFRGDFKLTGGEGFSTGQIVNLYYGATFLIGTQATFSYLGDSYVFYGTIGGLDVLGEFIRSAGNGTATLLTPVNNEGTMRAETGELVFGWGGTHTGQFIGGPGTTLGFGGDHTLTATSTLTADKVKLISGNNSMVHGTVNITDSILGTGAIWTFADDANIVNYGRHLNVNRGRVNFNAPIDQPIDFETVTITTPGEGAGVVDFNTGQPVNVETFTMIKGSLYGPSPINVSGTLSWTIGDFRSGGAITANGPVVFNATGSNRTLARILNITDQAAIYSGFGLIGGGRVNNLDSVVFNMQFNGGGIGGGTFNNYGTVLRSAGTGEISIGAAMNNSGLIHNQTGTLNLSGGGTHTGDLIADPGTILKIGGSGHSFETASTLTAETLNLSAFNSTFHGAVNVADAILCNGCIWTFANDTDVIDYGDHVTIDSGSLHFEAPTDRAIDFDTVTVGPNFNASSVYFDTGQPINTNTLLMSDKSSWSGTSPINIADQFTWNDGNFFAGGPIACYGTSNINATSSARTLGRPLNNYGTMTINGGFGTNASGPINNMPGALMDLRYENSRIGLTGVINNDGTIIKTTTAGNAGLPNVVNRGIIDIQEGGIDFHTTYSSLTQTAGETIVNHTIINLFSDNKPIYLQGGVLKGNGSVLGDIDNSGGTVAPGLSVGEIDVDDYTQGAGGVLEIEIGGTDPGEFDVLTVVGTATLGGELRVTDIDGFVPVGGNAFIILKAGDVDGTFDTENVPAHYEVVYSLTRVTVRSTFPSPDLNGDGFVDLLDFSLFQACFQGPGQPPALTCDEGVNADLDIDGDVDLDDFEMFYPALTGL